MADVWGPSGGPGGVFFRFRSKSGPNTSPFWPNIFDDLGALGKQIANSVLFFCGFGRDLEFYWFFIMFGSQNHQNSVVLENGKPSLYIVNNVSEWGSALFPPRWRQRCFLVPPAHFGLHFGAILEVLGTLLDPRGAIGEVLEGSENEVGKGILQIHASDEGTGGGGSLKEDQQGCA